MLTFRQLDDLPQGVVDIVAETEQTIIDDMARRITRLGSVTDSSVYQLERLQAIGAQHDFVVQELARMLNKAEDEVVLLFDEASTRTLAFDDKIYRAAGYSPVPLSENPMMQQLLWSGLEKTNGTFRNLTKTTAATATRQFEDALDIAHSQVATGAMDYQIGIRRGIKRLTLNGIETIRYTKTGWVDYLDVAFRRATLTGISQSASGLQEMRLDEMGCNIVETSAHVGARTAPFPGPENHAWWQGLRFFWSEKGGTNLYGLLDFIQSTGFGSGPGLCGWGCRHGWFPVPDPDAPLAHTAARLEWLNNRTVIYNGKEMSLYDATERQREIERKIRRWKRDDNTFAVAADAEPNPEKKAVLFNESWKAHDKVLQWQAIQRDFIKQTGLKRDYFRERAGKQYVE